MSAHDGLPMKALLDIQLNGGSYGRHNSTISLDVRPAGTAVDLV